MKASPPNTPRSTSPHRRRLVAGIGIGLCAAAAGWLRWPRPARKTNDTPASPHRPISADAPEASGTGDISRNSPNAPAFSREWFLPHLRSGFQVETALPSSVPLRLTDISPASFLTNGATTYSAFSLSFDGPADRPIESGIHRLKHEVLGEMDLFLSPVGPHSAPACYEATFTLRV